MGAVGERGQKVTQRLEEGGMLHVDQRKGKKTRQQGEELAINKRGGEKSTKGGKRSKRKKRGTNDASFELGLMKKQ